MFNLCLVQVWRSPTFLFLHILERPLTHPHMPNMSLVKSMNFHEQSFHEKSLIFHEQVFDERSRNVVVAEKSVDRHSVKSGFDVQYVPSRFID